MKTTLLLTASIIASALLLQGCRDETAEQEITRLKSELEKSQKQLASTTDVLYTIRQDCGILYGRTIGVELYTRDNPELSSIMSQLQRKPFNVDEKDTGTIRQN